MVYIACNTYTPHDQIKGNHNHWDGTHNPCHILCLIFNDSRAATEYKLIYIQM